MTPVAGKSLPKIAAFDFDGTIVSRDSSYLFIQSLIDENRLRKIAAGLIRPLIIPFFFFPPTWIIAVSLFLWIATVGRSEEALNQRFRQYVLDYLGPAINAKVYRSAIQTLAQHHREGFKILVLTGSLCRVCQPIIEKIVPEQICKDIVLLGSKEKKFLGGYILSEYCVNKYKVRMSRKAGYLDHHWEYGYSDSAFDIPMLALCQKRILINPSPKTRNKVRRKLGSNVKVLNWT